MPYTHPPRPAIGISAIVFDEQERVLLIQRGTAPAQGFWHPPGGKLEAGEGLAEAARREVWEETGVEVVIGPIMAVVERRMEGFHYVIVDFLAQLADPGKSTAKAADDVVAVAWIAEDELAAYPLAEGLLPILQQARLAQRGQKLGLHDPNGLGIDFMPIGAD